MQLQLGDRFTDQEGEWEVTHRPFTAREGKLVHATIQKPGHLEAGRDYPVGITVAVTTDVAPRWELPD